jgi:alpha-L-arabinofuranosidase
MKHAIIFFFLLLIFFSDRVVGQNTQISIHAGNPQTVISKHIYGHFAEHLGRCIYGGFYVGEQDKIPHVDGVRKDMVEALRKLKIPNLRWPGGCFADTYHWKDGIGPKEKRPSIVNTWWGGVTENNSFGTHDFLNMCELLGTEPYLAGNVGSGTVQELADWVQYVNFGGESPMSELREQNGRAKPWTVTLWGVGNETWGCGGNMRVEYYADIYRQYATFMNNWNSKKLFRVASGASSSDYHWTEVLMRDVPHNLLEGVALHHYSVIDWNNKGPATNFSDEQYFTIIRNASFMEELVTRHSTIMDKYDPAKKIALVVDEWGGWYNVEEGTNAGFLFQQNTMRDAVLAGVTLNIFNNHADRVRVANLAQAVNVLQAVILTDEEKMILTPTYHVLEMYNVHQDAKLLPLQFQSPQYEFNGQKIPAISASASMDADGRIHVSLVNADKGKTHTVDLVFPGQPAFKTFNGRILTSPSVTDHNTFANPSKIQPAAFKGFKVQNGKTSVTIPPASVIVMEMQ